VNITATIITLNEASRIRDCILSVQAVCDDVIVIDSLSKDNTVAEAEALGARVYRQEYLGDGPQKDYGVQFAKNDWILSIDADERLEEDAIAAIESLELEASTYQAYAFKRRNYVGSHWIKAAGFYPDYVTRLYNKNAARYLPKKAHSSVDARNVRKLDAHIRHLTYDNYTHWVERINRLSSRDAWAMYQRGVKANSATPLIHATIALFRKLVFKGGVFQGWDGFTVAITTAFHAYMKYIKLLELYENSQEQNRAAD
jgi:glycosyltransferase involved in cell wall biosynthesis